MTMDLSSALLNAGFADATLVCARQTQTIDQHGIASNTEEQIPFTGIVTHDSGNVLERTAQGARISAAITIHTPFKLSVGDATQGADIVTWKGRRYTVMNVADY